MNETRKSLIIIILIVVALIGVVIVLKLHSRNEEEFAQPIGKLRAAPNNELQIRIDDFMAKQTTEHQLGKENYQCSSFLYGYDDQYAYALVHCSGFTITDDGIFGPGFAMSAPTRLEYRAPHFNIIAFQQPEDGNRYSATLQELFPEELYERTHSDTDMPNLKERATNKGEAILQIKAQYPELKDYPSDQLPPRSILVEEDKDDLYIAFIQNGSGLPILEARCFRVTPDKRFAENGTFVPPSGDVKLYFSAKACDTID